ncbi:hypothetical protein PtA15_3A302 [Puccinia triticina]|uniref:Uncharacterized protein n=1 Tax=Puccinia triticina TaxID=208348 RepID=A0ABY7CG73_9BASI|nr:uncharacterized protein PtA15_3A302 [Puccinia triticina]WAQ82937.1 hypothetical protein PtA15_3A302 [Puccinia triticina]WAR53760.1 hypothetical protein PtB15_3B269 [Puccinia triticina]
MSCAEAHVGTSEQNGPNKCHTEQLSAGMPQLFTMFPDTFSSSSADSTWELVWAKPK